MFGNVSVPASQSDQTPLIGVNGSDQNKDANGNYLTQKENDMRPAVNTTELANGMMANRSIIDPIVPASIAQPNTAVDWPQELPTSTPFHGLVEEPETNASSCGSFQRFSSFLDRNIDPNDVTSTINVMLGNASMLTAQIDQSQATHTIENGPNDANNGIGIVETTNETTLPDATGPEFSDLADINAMNAPESKPIGVELPNATDLGGSIDIDDEIWVEEQAASSARSNESTNQVTECMDLTCEDVEPVSEGASNQIERNAVRRGGNQRRKRKIAHATTSDGSAKKRRKTGLSTLKTIPELTSEVALIDLTLNEIESTEHASSTSSQPVQEEGADSGGAESQSASTSNAEQVEKKKNGIGKHTGESGSKRHKCSFFERTSSYKFNLISHERIHTGEKPFKCEVCARGFTRKNGLIGHMRTHANEFPFHCSICRQVFKLKEEKETHEKDCNVRRYECYFRECELSIFYKSHLVRHMRIHHTGEKPFRCTHCPQRCTQKSDLNRHFKHRHNKTK